MNFSADYNSIASAASTLNMGTRGATILGISAPTLAGYSPVPSMQTVALEHGNAIAASPGNSIKVSETLMRELDWAATNLRSLATVISTHEDNMATNFRKINPETGAKQLTIGTETVAGTFTRRPPFNPGYLTFTPAVVTSELTQDASTLLGMFMATNDAAVGEAIAYWTAYAADMTAIAGEIATITGQLLAANQGDVFEAAAASLTGMAGKATNIAASAGIMIAHLEVLPAVKAMAINALGSIEAQSATMQDPLLKEAFERAEIAAFLNGPYLGQLQSAIPKIPNLTAPDLGGGIGSIAQAGASASGLGGTAQVGLSPAGLTGSIQAGTAPAAAQTTMPHSPTAMSHAPGQTTPAAGTSATTPHIPGSSTPAAPTPSAPTGPSTSSTMPGGLNAMSTPHGAASAPSRTTAATAHTPSRINSNSANSARPSPAGSSNSPRGLSPRIGTPATGAHTATPTPGSGRATTGVPATTAKSAPGNAATARVPSGTASQKLSAPPASVAATPAKQPAPSHTASSVRAGATKPGSLQSGFAAAMRQSVLQTANNAGLAGASAANGRREASIKSISNNASFFEQDEYQRELFGDEPATVPAVIGANVRS